MDRYDFDADLEFQKFIIKIQQRDGKQHLDDDFMEKHGGKRVRYF